MQLNIGDKVKFLNAEGGGKITQLIDKDTVMVLSDIDDFEIPVLITEVIPLERKESAVNKVDMSFSTESRRSIIKNNSLVFVDKKSEYTIHIANAEDTTLIYGIFIEKKEGIVGLSSGMLQANATQEIGTFSLKELDAILNWKVQGFYFEKQPKQLSVPLDCVVKVQPKKLFNESGKKFIEEIGQEGVIIPLKQKDNSVSELTAADFFADEATSQQPKKKAKRKDTSQLLEVDLHIHELLETTKGMSNGEMLEYQLDTFRKVLKENKKFKGKKIVFIHGVGNGVLKQRIRHELQKYPRYIVQDASFQEYGWGATMLIIK